MLERLAEDPAMSHMPFLVPGPDGEPVLLQLLHELPDGLAVVRPVAGAHVGDNVDHLRRVAAGLRVEQLLRPAQPVQEAAADGGAGKMGARR